MKTQVLLFLILSFFSFSATHACRFYVPVGIIRVIDQHGNTIKNANVYRFYSQSDSFPLMYHGQRLINSENGNKTIDSGTFVLSSYNGNDNIKIGLNSIDKVLLIQAPGYADVSIMSVIFKRDKRKEYRSIPILEVVMYAKKLVRADNEFKVYESYFLQDEIKVIDSLRIELADYLLDIKTNEISAVKEEEVSHVSAKAYPNPVVDELHIQFSFAPQAPHKIMLHDAVGKLVYEANAESAEHEIHMNWYSAGTYYLTIYDPIGSPLLRQQIIKQ